MSGIRVLGDTVTYDFTTHHPSSGTVVDADAVPTAKIFENTDATAMTTPNVAKRGTETGNYYASFDLTSADGFEAGKCYNVIVTATVDSVTAKARIASFVVDTKRLSNLNDVSLAGIDTTLTSSHGSGTWVTVSSTQFSGISLSGVGELVWTFGSRSITQARFVLPSGGVGK